MFFLIGQYKKATVQIQEREFSKTQIWHLTMCRREMSSSLATASSDLALYSSVGRVPAVKTFEGTFPLSIAAFAGSTEGRRGYIDSSFTSPAKMAETISKWEDQKPERTTVTPEGAAHLILTNLTQFLGLRIAGMRHWIATQIDDKVGHVSPANGDDADFPTNSCSGDGLFTVTVDCTKKNCRIFVSPAYFIDWVYFGYPSTPVVGHLMAGRYIFGTDSVKPSVTEDSAVFRIPNSFHPVLKRF